MFNVDKTWEFEGDLYSEKLGYSEPLRTNYAKHQHDITCGLELRSSLRAGDFTFPGGYPVMYITDDGGILCPDCVRDNFQSVIWSIRNQCSDGWRVWCTSISFESDECSHCSKTL